MVLCNLGCWTEDFKVIGLLNNTHKLIVMGFLTPDAREQPSALKTASMVEQNPRIKVVFVNLEQEWLPGSRVSIGFGNFSFLRLPQLPNFRDWRWWFNVVKANPLILVLAFSLFLGMLPEVQKVISAPSMQQIQQPRESRFWRIENKLR
ncbi:MAG: hypothetical protein AB3A66_30275 (plasmid) [Nodularia sp. CChRGM 3473]